MSGQKAGQTAREMWENPGYVLCRRETDGALVLAEYVEGGEYMTKSDGQSRSWLIEHPWPDETHGYRVVHLLHEDPTP